MLWEDLGWGNYWNIWIVLLGLLLIDIVYPLWNLHHLMRQKLSIRLLLELDCFWLLQVLIDWICLVDLIGIMSGEFILLLMSIMKWFADHDRNLRFSGFVTWTGNSSMEVVVKMQGSRSDLPAGSSTSSSTSSSSEEEWETLMLGRFAMVCRDAKTLKARKVPQLLVESEEEKMLWSLGEGELISLLRYRPSTNHNRLPKKT